MERNFDHWILSALEDLERTMDQRKLSESAKGMAHLRQKVAGEIKSVHGEKNFKERSNVVQLFA